MGSPVKGIGIRELHEIAPVLHVVTFHDELAGLGVGHGHMCLGSGLKLPVDTVAVLAGGTGCGMGLELAEGIGNAIDVPAQVGDIIRALMVIELQDIFSFGNHRWSPFLWEMLMLNYSAAFFASKASLASCSFFSVMGNRA